MKIDVRFKRFLERRSTIDIFNKLGKIDIKELSETIEMFEFIRKSDVWNEKNLNVLEIGCGKRPTLSLILLHNTKNWKVTAVDPIIEEKDYKTQRFDYFKCRLRDFAPSLKYKVIVGNHSHCDLKEIKEFCLKYNMPKFHYFTCPCCVDNVFRNVVGKFYISSFANTPKNIYYYQEVNL